MQRLGPIEWRVMSTIWRLGEATGHNVADALDDRQNRAYITTISILNRLVDKGYVTIEKDHPKPSLYVPVVSLAEGILIEVAHYLASRCYDNPRALQVLHEVTGYYLEHPEALTLEPTIPSEFLDLAGASASHS